MDFSTRYSSHKILCMTDRNKGLTRKKTQAKDTNAGDDKHGRNGSLLEAFFTDQLKSIYYAEQQLLKAIPKMVLSSATEELRNIFVGHLQQTKKHVKRLDEVFKTIGEKAQETKCRAVDELLREVETVIKKTNPESVTRDAALIIAAQKLEHYEIATYGGLAQLALTMEWYHVGDILDKTLVEEEATDALLTEIAENYINICARDEADYCWQKNGDRETVHRDLAINFSI